MFEMLASVLAAAPIQARALGPERRKSLSQNIAILAVDVAAFRPVADFARDAEELAAVIKSLPRQTGVDEIRLPGERAACTEAVRRKSGIPIPGKLWEELAAIAAANRLSLPESLSPPTN
jgi:LDH2 family malate/lactate/ureidoglycolate dehydrogenase